MRNFPFWLPWLGLVVVAGIVGGGLGLAGVLGHPTTNRAVFANDASLARTTSALSCPGGSEVTRLQAGDRVIAIARSSDSSYLEVRNPLNLSQDVWVQSSVMKVDSGNPAMSTLPVDICSITTAAPTKPSSPHHGSTPTQPTKPVIPTKPTKPTPPDKTAPKIGVPTAGTAIVCTYNSDPPHNDVITVTATDNVGVTSVAISWSGAVTGSGHMTHKSGSTWTFQYNVGTSNAAGTITFQVQARDAAGNLSSASKVNVTQGGCVG